MAFLQRFAGLSKDEQNGVFALLARVANGDAVAELRGSSVSPVLDDEEARDRVGSNTAWRVSAILSDQEVNPVGGVY